MPSIFVSYSHRDKRWFASEEDNQYSLIPWLEQSLKRHDVHFWYDRSDEHGLQPGDPFRQEIERAIDEASMALLLLTEAFLSSDFIQTVELPRIEARVQQGAMIAIPILLEPCAWQDSKFIAERQMLPGKPTPLVDYTDSLSRWTHGRDEILRGIRACLRRITQPPSQKSRQPLAEPPLSFEGPLPIVQAPVPRPLQGEEVLIGREQELRALASAWELAQKGAARVVLVSGEAGMGKTRCITEFLRQSRGQEAYILISRAAEDPPSRPYQAVSDLLSPAVEQGAIPEMDDGSLAEVARIVPELIRRRPGLPQLTSLPAEQEQSRFRSALMSYMTALCARAPVILFLDDLQWIDEPSLTLLQDFLVLHNSVPLLLVASLRSEESLRSRDGRRNSARLRRWRDTLRQKSVPVEEVALRPWKEAETRQFISAQLGIPEAPIFSARLHTASGGNPLYVAEILTSLRQQGLLFQEESGEWSTPFDDSTLDYGELPIPESLHVMVSRRMDSLSDEACRFLQAAAVLGRQFDPEIAQETSGLSIDQRDRAVDELTAAQLIVIQDFDHCFRHSIHRNVVYSALKKQAGEYRRLHERAGYAILEFVGPSPTPSEVQALAHHFYLGQVWDKALTYQLKAGLNALALYDARTARSYLDRARQLLQSRMRRAPDEVHLTCLEGLGDAEALLGNFDEARQCYDAVLQRGPASIHGRIHVKIADTFYRQSAFEKATDRLKEALAASAAAADPVVVSRAHLLSGMIHARKRELEQALAETREALAQESARAHLLMANVRRELGDQEEAIHHCRLAIAQAEADHDPVTLAKAYTNLGVLLMDAGRFAEARQTYQRSLEMQKTTGDAYSHALTLCNLAEAHRYLGDLDQSAGCAQAGLAEFQRQQSAFGEALAHLNLGEVLLEQGEPKRARVEHLEIARGLLEKNRIADNLCEVVLAMAESYLAEGMLADAEQMGGRALEMAEKEQDAGNRASALRVLAVVRHRQGNYIEAEALLRRSEEALRASGLRYDLGRTRMAQAELYAADPARLAEAQSALQEALAIFEGLGAILQLKKARALEVTS